VAKGREWNNAEIDAAVSAYIEMLKAEKSGRPLVKAEVNRRLRDGKLSNRTKGSIELRMQNISAVVVELGLERIEGYVPRQNVGSHVTTMIQDSLIRTGLYDPLIYHPTADKTELEKRTKAILQKGQTSIPPGQQKPRKTTSERIDVERDPAVRAWILNNSGGQCELCEQRGPFLTPNGDPFLEVHHVELLADGGPDVVQNAVALCPNCHRRCHYGIGPAMLVRRLREKIPRLEDYATTS
jgi:5-methylcytosine-specific restriction enzyme A